VQLAESNLERERARRKVGASTSFEVQQRNQELREAWQRLLRNQLDYRIAEAELLFAEGLLNVGSKPGGVQK
jgi:outer membrane protein TolC